MAALPDHLTPQIWLNQIFTSREAAQGGVVKRQVRDVERLVGRRAFEAELTRRGYQAVENNRYFVIFCNRLPITRVRAFEGP
ncbi:N-(5'-phosphoribosyl)anthranilate isomerase [uncultured Roseobacter sp.]|uniref:N-(5'-phosphoribosyl)anthranilate isomerase n=1 Tax=uncultured Roseobacter sp. TaxID=114847 RepID=UPI0026089F30|nr:N-(5'-phosphoribosyl)anthranilate isomerase [uncultured Roseobacter sp.]